MCSPQRCRRTRWAALAAGVLIESAGGLFYIFGVYSSELKRTPWGGGGGVNSTLTQNQLDAVVVASNIAGNLGTPAGFFYDRVGPSATVLAGGTMGVLGWGLMWALLSPSTQRASPWPWWLLVVAASLQGQAALITDLSVIPTVASNFPQHRGLGIGLSKAMVGISGSLATTVYLGFFCDSAPAIAPFLLAITVVVACICTVGALPLSVRPAAEVKRIDAAPGAFARTTRTFVVGFVLTTALLLLCLVGAVLDALIGEGSSTSGSSGLNRRSGGEQCPAFDARYRMGFALAAVALLLALVATLALCRDRAAGDDDTVSRPRDQYLFAVDDSPFAYLDSAAAAEEEHATQRGAGGGAEGDSAFAPYAAYYRSGSRNSTDDSRTGRLVYSSFLLFVSILLFTPHPLFNSYITHVVATGAAARAVAGTTATTIECTSARRPMTRQPSRCAALRSTRRSWAGWTAWTAAATALAASARSPSNRTPTTRPSTSASSPAASALRPSGAAATTTRCGKTPPRCAISLSCRRWRRSTFGSTLSRFSPPGAQGWC